MKRLVTAIAASAMFAGASYAADVTVDADITADTTWTSDNTYILDGFITVKEGANLTIEPGTVIMAEVGTGPDASALIISRGSKIFAVGTPKRPIIFTSINDPMDGSWGPEQGSAWGGLILLGQAPINSTKEGIGTFPGLEDIVEGVPAALGADSTTYGGEDENDSSGIVRYVSIRFGGSPLEANEEINGLTLAGVGQNTIIEFVEIFANSDDGIEWFGGNVNCRYLVSAMGGDDGFDYDQGWGGKGQFWFYYTKDVEANNFDTDNGGEHDGELNSQGGPIGGATVYNATFIGGDDGGDHAFKIRDNGFAKYFNSVFTDFGGVGIEVEADGADQLNNGSIEFSNNIWYDFNGGSVADTAESLASGDDGNNDDESGFWTDASLLNEIEDPMIRSISRDQDGGLDPRPAADSPALTNTLKSVSDSFFRSVPYQGAFSSTSNWLYGWTYLDEGGYLVDQNNVSGARAVNVSTRQDIPGGGSVTAGFVVEGELPRAVLIRAVGAKLGDSAIGVPNAAQDTSFTVFNSNQEAIATVDDWNEGQDGGALVAAISKAVGAFALTGGDVTDTTSAAGYFIVEPGLYTVQATNKDSGTGNVIIEVYDVDS